MRGRKRNLKTRRERHNIALYCNFTVQWKVKDLNNHLNVAIKASLFDRIWSVAGGVHVKLQE